MTLRFPPFQVVPFGCEWLVRCAECGEVEQVHSESSGRQAGREHQRWTHPTDEEQELDRLRAYEYGVEMLAYCVRCGHEGHRGPECPTVTPDLLKEHRA